LQVQVQRRHRKEGEDEKGEHLHVALRQDQDPARDFIAEEENARAFDELVVPLVENAIPTLRDSSVRFTAIPPNEDDAFTR